MFHSIAGERANHSVEGSLDQAQRGGAVAQTSGAPRSGSPPAAAPAAPQHSQGPSPAPELHGAPFRHLLPSSFPLPPSMPWSSGQSLWVWTAAGHGPLLRGPLPVLSSYHNHLQTQLTPGQWKLVWSQRLLRGFMFDLIFLPPSVCINVKIDLGRSYPGGHTLSPAPVTWGE